MERSWISGAAAGVALALVVCTSSSAAADEIVIGSGQQGGYYDTIARGLRALLTTELGVLVDHRSSAGSVANLSSLADPESPVSIAFTQADALEVWLESSPEFKEQVRPIGKLGKECAFLIASTAESGSQGLDELNRSGSAIAVGEGASGAAVTWPYLGDLRSRPPWLEPRHVDVAEAMLGFGKPEAGDVAAALVIQRPIAMGGAVEMVLANPERFRFVAIRAEDVGPRAADPSIPYTFEKVKVGFGTNYSAEVETVCTRGLALAHKDKLGAKRLAAIERAVLESGDLVFRGSR